MRVLMFIEDPGAANFLMPVLSALVARGHDVQLRVEGAARRYIDQNFGGPRQPPEDGADQLIARLKPDVVVIGTSENEDTLGLSLVEAARRRGIPSVGAVDILANAERRFRGRGAGPLAFAPDVILTADPVTRAAFVGLGHDPAKVIDTGHPHYDEVRSRARVLEVEGRAAVRRRCLPEAPADRRVLVFAAEVSTGLNAEQYMASPSYTLHGSGRRHLRTDIVLEELLEAVKAQVPRPHMVLRLHPKNSRAEFADFLQDFDAVSDSGPALDLIYAADAVVGMSSMLLFEAALIGRPTLAILPREVEKAWLPAEAQGVIPVATTRADVRRMLQALFTRDMPGHAQTPPGSAAEIAVNAVLAAVNSAA